MWVMSEMWELVEFPLSVAQIKSLYNFAVRHTCSEVRPDTLPIGSSWQVGRSSYLGGQGGGCI